MRLHDITALHEITVRAGLVMRPLELSDGEQLLKVLDHDPAIRKRASVAARLHSLGDVEREVAAIAADDGLIRYAVHSDDEVVGLISLWRDDGFFGQQPEVDSYGFGYFLDPNSRGQGIITASLKSIMDTVRDVLPVRSFIAFCEDDNPESFAVLTRLGFERTDEVYGEPNTGWQERKYRRVVS